MPSAPLRPCSHSGCGTLTSSGRCDRHQRPAYDRERGTAAQRGYDYRWQKYRDWFVRQTHSPECGRNHALCEGECARLGRATPAFAVDPVIPHRGNQELFWKHSNHRALCERNTMRNREPSDPRDPPIVPWVCESGALVLNRRDILKWFGGSTLPLVQAVEQLEVGPGDAIVLKFKDPLSEQTHALIQEIFQTCWNGRFKETAVIVLDRGTDIQVLKRMG